MPERQKGTKDEVKWPKVELLSPTTRMRKCSSSSSVQHVLSCMEISRKRKELSEICWWQNAGFSVPLSRVPKGSQLELVLDIWYWWKLILKKILCWIFDISQTLKYYPKGGNWSSWVSTTSTSAWTRCGARSAFPTHRLMMMMMIMTMTKDYSQHTI